MVIGHQAITFETTISHHHNDPCDVDEWDSWADFYQGGHKDDDGCDRDYDRDNDDRRGGNGGSWDNDRGNSRR